MNIIKWLGIWVSVFCLLECLNAQAQVLDKDTNEPLAFVHILPNGQAQNGRLTDIDGRFDLDFPDGTDSLTFTYLGYAPLTLSLIFIKKEKIILLKPKGVGLPEIVVLPGENPAHRIIKKAISNKDKNNPEKNYNFKYKSYNKFVTDLEFHKEIYEDKALGGLFGKFRDSSLTRARANALEQRLDNSYLMIMESVTERQFSPPDKNKEIVLASQISGIEEPAISALATSFQPFSFYRDYIFLIDKNYINPISKGSIQKYLFQLEPDTLFQGRDTIYKISFRPRKGKNFNGLTGILHINTNGYAIQNVQAEPYQATATFLKVEQQYQLIDNKQWFPVQLNFEMNWKNGPYAFVNTVINGRSYLEDIKVDIEINKKTFGADQLTNDEAVHERTEDYWKEERIQPLTDKEKATYIFMEKMNKEMNLNFFYKMIEDVSAYQQITLGKIALDLPRFLSYNNFEGSTFGIGVHTSKKLSKKFSAGGYVRYGELDKKYKYGGDVSFKFSPKIDGWIKLSYQKDLREPGQVYEPVFPINYVWVPGSFQRSFQTQLMDEMESYRLELGLQPLNFTRILFFTQQNKHTPLYNYQFENASPDFTFFETGVRLRWAYKEQTGRINGARFILESRYPKIFLTYTKGWDNLLTGQFDFHKIEFATAASFPTKYFGQTTLFLESGFVSGTLPYSKLFNGNGSFSRDEPFLIWNTFQTMRLYEFINDKYINLFIYQDFGNLIFNFKKWKPRFLLVQGIGWGDLSNPENHRELEFQTLQNGYYESGLIIQQLLRFKIFNIGYIGFGAGGFYRYGPYHLPELLDNFALKGSVSFSFN